MSIDIRTKKYHFSQLLQKISNQKNHFKAWHGKILSLEIGKVYLQFNMASKKIAFFVESMSFCQGCCTSLC